MALSATDRVIRVQGPLYTPVVSIVVQVNLVVYSILRAVLFLLPQFNFAFTVAIFIIETCLIDILVVAIGVCTFLICTLAYYSFITLIWCMRGIVNRVGLREVEQSLIPGRQCGIGRYFSIVLILFMIPASLLYTHWHFNFVRQTWLHEFVVVIQVLHLLPTSLMIFTTLGQGLFLVGVLISTNPLQNMALTHGGKVKEHVRAFAGLNLALLFYSASAIIIACRQGVNEIDRKSRLVWVMEIVFRLLSVAVAVYVEWSIGQQNLPPPGRREGGGHVELEDREPLNAVEVARDEAQDQSESVSLSSEPLGTGQHAGGGVEDHEPLHEEEEASGEVLMVCQDSRVQWENVSLLSQTPSWQECQAEQAILQSVDSEPVPFITVPNSEYMELPIPTSRPVDKPFLVPYGEEFYEPGSRVAQETNRDSAPNELATLHRS